MATGYNYYPGDKDSNTTWSPTTPALHMSDHGTLWIEPHRAQGTDGQWWSGKVETRREFVARPGKKTLFEARVKIGDALSEHLAGISHRIYTMSPDFLKDSINWPRMGEWDILELNNGLESFVPVLHCGETAGGPCKEPEGFKANGAYTISRGQFHTVGFEINRKMCSESSNDSSCWREETVTWHLDDEPQYRIKGSDLGDKDAWSRLFHQPRVIAMAVAVGGSRVGAAPNHETFEGEPAGMEIDYISVWESK